MHGQVAYFNKSFTYFLQGLKNCALQIERLLHPNVQATASKHVTMDSCGYRLCRYSYRNRFFLRQKCFILYLLKKILVRSRNLIWTRIHGSYWKYWLYGKRKSNKSFLFPAFFLCVSFYSIYDWAKSQQCHRRKVANALDKLYTVVIHQ